MLTCDSPTLNLPFFFKKNQVKNTFRRKREKFYLSTFEYSFAPFQIQKIWITFEKRITIWPFHAKYSEFQR